MELSFRNRSTSDRPTWVVLPSRGSTCRCLVVFPHASEACRSRACKHWTCRRCPGTWVVLRRQLLGHRGYIECCRPCLVCTCGWLDTLVGYTVVSGICRSTLQRNACRQIWCVLCCCIRCRLGISRPLVVYPSTRAYGCCCKETSLCVSASVVGRVAGTGIQLGALSGPQQKRFSIICYKDSTFRLETWEQAWTSTCSCTFVDTWCLLPSVHATGLRIFGKIWTHICLGTAPGWQ